MTASAPRCPCHRCLRQTPAPVLNGCYSGVVVTNCAEGDTGALGCAVGAGGVLTCVFFALVAVARLSDYLRQKPERPFRESLADTALLLPRALRRGWRVTPPLALVTMVIFVATCAGIYRWVQVTQPQDEDDFRDAGSAYLGFALTSVSLCFGYLLGGLQKDIATRARTSRVDRFAPWVVVVFLSVTLWLLTHQVFDVAAKHLPYVDDLTWMFFCLPLWLSLSPSSSHDQGPRPRHTRRRCGLKRRR